jgi:acyl carrier protein
MLVPVSWRPAGSGVAPLLYMSNGLYYLAIILLLLFVFAIPLSMWENRARKKKLETAFAGRASLDEQTFYERYFRSRGVPADVVVKVRRILEDELDADLSRLAAEDDFSRNLSFFWEYDSLADVEIIMRLEEEFGIKIANDEAGQTKTIEDIVNLVWKKLRSREP